MGRKENISIMIKNKIYESVKNNNLIIKITNDEYVQINLLINKLKHEYNLQLDYIQKNKKNFDKILLHNQLVKTTIKEVIDHFSVIKKYNVCVFVTGSFARCTNKFNSDLDLHFCYKNIYKNILFKYEEMIYYILFSIFNINREKVHNMILSRYENKKIVRIMSIVDNNDLMIILKNDDNEISYKINGKQKRRIYSQYLNKKDIKTMYKYLRNELLTYNREWVHTFYAFSNDWLFTKYYKKLLIIEDKNKSIDKINKRKEDIVTQIEFINSMINTIDKENICDFKKMFQMEEFKLLYNYISYRRDLYLLYNKKWDMIDFSNIDNYLNNDIVFPYIKDYMYSLFNLVESFKNEYSIHKSGYINKECYDLQIIKLLRLNSLIGGVL